MLLEQRAELVVVEVNVKVLGYLHTLVSIVQRQSDKEGLNLVEKGKEGVGGRGRERDRGRDKINSNFRHIFETLIRYVLKTELRINQLKNQIDSTFNQSSRPHLLW